MKKDPRKSISSGLEIQSNELNDDQLDEVTGGIVTVMIGANYRRCGGEPSHIYVARKSDDVCPVCGTKEFTTVLGG